MKTLRPVFFLFLFLSCCSWAFSQVKNAPGMELPIKKAKGPIVLDGKIDEQDWQDAAVATNFYLNYPVDTALAPFQTEARLTFDDRHLYVSFVCYDDKTHDIVQSLRRDFDYSTNDNIGIYFGPYNDGINGFYFQTTPFGVQGEGTISAAGADDNSYNGTWDNKWYNKVTRYDDRWVVEMMIPFKSFRFKSDAREWNVTFLRSDLKRNLTSSWIATPIQFIPASFAYSGKLMWEELPHHTPNISLIPYIAGGTSNDKTTVPVTKDNELQAGFDAKIGVTPSLNLDLTVNPDFSQVEVDRQVINLTRFEFQFPERRQFFLENSDLFDRMGYPDARPFFSRRVGLARDTSGVLKRVPILYGARLSGSLSKKWRISILNMQTKEALNVGLPQQNFTSAAIQRNFWKQSNIQFSFVNKQTFGFNALGDSVKYYNPSLWKRNVTGPDSSYRINDYNRDLTVDLESRSVDNKWYTSLYYSKSFSSWNSDKNTTGGGYGQYTVRNLQISGGTVFVQKNYTAEAGYVPSRGVYPGVTNSFFSIYGTIYPKNSILVNMRPTLDLSSSFTPDRTITDKAASLGYFFNFLNTSFVGIMYTTTFQQLTNDFSPIDADKYTNFITGERYSWNRISFSYQSDQRKRLKYTLGTAQGGFYNGDNSNFNGEINFRYQPYGSVSVRFDYNDLRLPGSYGQEKLFVVSPRFDLTFTKSIFLTTFVQYNSLLDNVNLNARFQWRYKPASDFFVVYTENYLPEHLVSKSQSLVFKLTYWLNI